MTHVYIVASSREIPRVREVERELVRAGCTIAGDWIAPVERYGTAGESLSDLDRAKYARADLDAIGRADVVLVLWPRTESVGAYFEAGYAFARMDQLGIPLVVAGEPPRHPDRPSRPVTTIWHSLIRHSEVGRRSCSTGKRSPTWSSGTASEPARTPPRPPPLASPR